MKVFVSYSRDDAPYARELSAALRKRGIDVSSDMSITAGASWATELRRMMDDADAFVLLTSKSSAASGSIDLEVAAAAARASRDRNIRLIPVVLDRRAEIPPLLSRYQFVEPQVARDPDRVADLIQESLSVAVAPPDLNLEREIVNAERANLNMAIAGRDLVVARSWRALARVLSVAGLIAGVTATTLVAVWVNASPHAASVVIAVISVVSASLSAAVGIYFRRSRNDD
jgi:hypothetical protein